MSAMLRTARRCTFAGALLLLAGIWVATQAAGSSIERVSVGAGGKQPNGPCLNVAISPEGRLAAFSSRATNLTPEDTNAAWDVFVCGRTTDLTELVSVSMNGGAGNRGSDAPALSADGRFVAFVSGASDLVPGDTNDATDVFVRDRLTRKTERVSVSTNRAEANDGSGAYPAISADGRFVAFVSAADNLVEVDTNGRTDVFVRDRQEGTTERVSVSTGGEEAIGGESGLLLSISANGRFVAFASDAANLIDDDTNDHADVFVRDRLESTTERASLSWSGKEGNADSIRPAISADGRYVAFLSEASNLVTGDENDRRDVFVRDRVEETTIRVSVSSESEEADADSSFCAISGDGRFVAFHTGASNLVPDDQNEMEDVFLRDLAGSSTVRVSLSTEGTDGNGESVGAVLTDDGSCVAFLSSATNLVDGDTNSQMDAFVWQQSPTSASTAEHRQSSGGAGG